jgi:hypothetical protein
MAKFVIYNKTHWMDLPSKSEPGKTGFERNEAIIQSKPFSSEEKVYQLLKLQDKHNAIEIKGDILEIKPDDYKINGKEKLSFVVISVPEISYENALLYQEPLRDGNIMKKRRKYNLDIQGINFNNDGEATLKLETFIGRLTIKQ